MTHLLRGLLQAVFRQRAIMTTMVVGALAAAGAASALLPPVWRATAIIGTPQDLADTTGIGLLASHDLHRQVVNRIGAAALYPGLDAEAAADAFGHDINLVQRQEDSVELTLDNRDPAMAARALQATIDVLNEQRTRLLADSGKGALDQQEAAYKRALDEARRRLDDYRQKNKVWSGEEERRQMLAQRGDLANELQRTVNSENELAIRMRSLKNQLAQVPNTVTPTEPPAEHYKVLDDAKGRLLELQLKEQELLAKYKEGSQFVTTVREEISRVKAFITDMTASVSQRNKPSTNDLYVELSKEVLRAETQMNSLEARRAALETQLGQMDQHMEEMNNSDHELRGLQQLVAEGQSNLRRIAEARAAQAAGTPQANGISVIQAPHPPAHPIQPNPRLYFSLALPLGLLGGILAALLAQFLSGSFATPADVERRLGLPVLAALPFKP